MNPSSVSNFGGNWCIDNDLKAMFESCIIEHEKFYDTLEEKEKRLHIFKDAFRFIDRVGKCIPNKAVMLMEELLCLHFSRPKSQELSASKYQDVPDRGECDIPPIRKQELFDPTEVSASKNKKNPAFSDVTLDQQKALYESYLIEHDKFYKSPKEKEERFQAFRKTLRYVDQYNSTHDPSRWIRLTYFSDMNYSGGKVVCRREPVNLTEDSGSEDEENHTPSERTLDEERAMFESYLIEHGRFYKSHKEKERRFKMFRKTLKFIDRYNSDHDPSERDHFYDTEDLASKDKENHTPSKRTLDEVKAIYDSYLIEHDRLYYMYPKEKEKRFQIFRKTLWFMDHYNTTCHPCDRIKLSSNADMPHTRGCVIPRYRKLVLFDLTEGTCDLY
ncbi:hypothetical protein E3N88_19254 [Mikania micrantha]|uniref:Cathepsin propeptide inhibitor domain-containing protein n=1 Tax=Mikania micrantha TaxID=192012 RepID=A0A5N6NQD9_9ASTR|nr:hypothetical protein E3N88_19254 [Mikania micrantha]